MSIRPEQPTTVGDLIYQLRRMLGHLGTRDRGCVLSAIAAIEELTTRLHSATHVAPKPAGGLTVTTIPDDDAAEVLD